VKLAGRLGLYCWSFSDGAAALVKFSKQPAAKVVKKLSSSLTLPAFSAESHFLLL
jgi:hypothetical protein